MSFLRSYLNNQINNEKKERNTALGYLVIFLLKESWKAQINFQISNTGNLLCLVQELQKGEEEQRGGRRRKKKTKKKKALRNIWTTKRNF